MNNGRKTIIKIQAILFAVLFAAFAFAGCKNNDNSNNNNSEAEVVLDKVSAAAYKEPSVKPQKMAAFNLS